MSAAEPPGLFCRALYNYDAQESSCLSFRQNDILEVLTQKPSGWWDGLLGDERGWFPSNYVIVISDEEAELALSDSQPPADTQTNTHADTKSGLGQTVQVLTETAPGLSVGDFWMPQVTADGRIYYVNTQTGQHAEDLPGEGDMDMGVALGRGRDQTEQEPLTSGSTPNDEFSQPTGNTIVSPDPQSSEKDQLPEEPPMYEEVESPVQSPADVRPTRLCSLRHGEVFLPLPLPQPASADEIVIDLDGTVRGGTVPALVEHLTTHEFCDQSFNKSFLMTFKSFTTTDKLFDLLVQRFWIQPPPMMTVVEREEWIRLKQRVIQMRVLNIFKAFIVDDDVDKTETGILHRIKEFITIEEVARLPAAKQLSTLIERARHGDSMIKMVAASQGMPPPPLVPKSSKKLKLLEIEPLELARQLTIKDSRLYQRIRSIDCLQRIWDLGTENIDNIAVFTQTTNKILFWVVESILEKDDWRRRVGIVEQFISVADHCRTLNNFSSLAAITAGLDALPIRRLTRTWAQVSPRSTAQFDVCKMIISSSKGFLTYRTMLKSALPPCVPFIGIYLSNLQYIVDGFPDNLPSREAKEGAGTTFDLVYFKKRQKISEFINEIKRWQVPFNLHVIPSVQAYIEDCLNSVSDTPDPAERFEAMSLELEPRQMAEEKMARWLQDSFM
ncbi:ras guanine nucleotide exchange factor domain-containing protein [Mycena sanguinolenta]|nr:ras guanine nucleotide exchange factor domain-containing protein [Mycena sanguinolenta]